jgi:hypothetical protein
MHTYRRHSKNHFSMLREVDDVYIRQNLEMGSVHGRSTCSYMAEGKENKRTF